MIVVVVVADSLRADAPAFAGGPVQTPVLDRLAREGSSFRHSVASAAWTVPSMVSIVTGSFPHRVGVGRWRHPFPRHRPTLMTAFAAAGFEVKTLVHNPRFFLANTGFRGESGTSEVPDEVITALQAKKGVDRLVFVHHWWTHLPYRNEFIKRKPWKRLCDLSIEWMANEPEEAVPREKEAYHGCVSYFDDLLGRYIEAAQSSGNEVLLAVTGDHGENWGESLPAGKSLEHIYDLHGRWLTEETTRVPLLFWGSGCKGALPGGQVLGGFARGVDLAPTLAGLAGVPWPGPLPVHEGPTLIDRGIQPDGRGLVLDGLSLANSVWTGAPSPVQEALTVTSHNAIVPAQYPTNGRRMWRRFGLRTPSRRYQWDGASRMRLSEPVDDGFVGGQMSGPSSLWRRLGGDFPIWSQLAGERREALGPNVPLPKSLFKSFGDLDAGDAALEGEGPSATLDSNDQSEIGESMRTLGYLD